MDLATALGAGTWQPKPGLVFVTKKPKHREIHAARFEDRVVHHLIMDALAPELERRFSPASFACRQGMGTHAAAEALRGWLWRLSRRGQRRVWVLRMDVRNFFHSLHIPTLWQLLQPPVDRVTAAATLPFDVRAAVRALLLDRPGLRAHRAGRPAEFERVPAHKRLAAQDDDRGLPIGNLTSQWFANAYLDGLDHFVQRQLGIGAYVRYMDDFVLCDPNPARLEAARVRIIAWLQEHRSLTVHGDWPLCRAADGVDFVGHIVRPAYALVRRRVVKAAHERLWRRQAPLRPRWIAAGATLRLQGGLAVAGPAAVFPLPAGALCTLRGAWAAFAAATRMAAGAGQRRRMRRCQPLLGLHLDERGGSVRLRFAPGAGRPAGLPDPGLRAQLRRLVGRRRDVVALVQVGNHAELLRPQDWRRLPAAPRRLGGGRFGAGIPLSNAAAWVARLLQRGNPALWLAESGERAGTLAERTPAALILPLERAATYWAQQAATAWLLPRCTALRRGPRYRPRRPTLRRPGSRPPAAAAAVLAPSPAPQPAASANGQYLLPFPCEPATLCAVAPEPAP